MTNSIKSISTKTYAKFAGLLYLLIAISGGFSIGYVPTVIMATGDAAATAQNIADNSGLFKLGIIADIFVFLIEIVLTVMLYRLLKPVNKTLAMVATFSRLAMSIIMGLNLLNYIIPLQLLNGADYLNVFEQTELQALALLFLETHQYVVYIWGIFFGLHLVTLGYLVYKSGYFPWGMGLMMMIGSLGYFGESLVNITFGNKEAFSIAITIFLVISVIGELSFTFWLLIKGIKNEPQ